MLSLTDDGYTIAQAQRTRRRYSGGGGSADMQDTQDRLWQLREIARKHDRQSPLLAGALNTGVSQIVGPQFKFRPNTGDEGFDTAAEQWIEEQQQPDICDVRGERDFTEILGGTLRAWWTDGDVLHRRVAGGALQTWEADQVVSPRGVDTGDKNIVNGLEKAPSGRTVAYWVTKAGTRAVNGFVGAMDDITRISANQCWLPAYRKRFNQGRGAPFVASALSFYDRFWGYLDDEALAAGMNAKLGLQITHDPVDTDEPSGTQIRTDPNADSNTETSFDRVLRMETGQVFDMNLGEEVKMVGASRPGDTFEPYCITACRVLGVGLGFPLELFLLDFSKSNYSSSKAVLEVTHRSFRGWQRSLCNQFCMPWYRWQIDRGIASRALPPIPNAHKAQCVWPAWAYIDPEKEAKANRITLEDRIESPQQIIRERGRDPDDVVREWSEWQKKLAAAEVAPVTAVTQWGPDDKDEEDKMP